jgi:hypothetical protein
MYSVQVMQQRLRQRLKQRGDVVDALLGILGIDGGIWSCDYNHSALLTRVDNQVASVQQPRGNSPIQLFRQRIEPRCYKFHIK